MNYHRIRISSKYKPRFCRKDNFVMFVYLGQVFLSNSHVCLYIYMVTTY